MIAKVLKEPEDPTLHLPRILCLHGGGTNARIFRAQCRVLTAQLKSIFRLCFAEGPFPSSAGPDVVSVYKDYGPFRSWIPRPPEHPNIEAAAAVGEVDKSLDAAMTEDDRKGADGEWVALLGFSQGAGMSASLLLRQQVRAERLHHHPSGTTFRFGVLLAGRGPLLSLEPQLFVTASLNGTARRKERVLRLPTIHIHGMRDDGLPLHRQLFEKYCESGSTRLIEWDGQHRVPIRTKDVTVIVREILSMAKDTGVLKFERATSNSDCHQAESTHGLNL